MIVVVPTIMHSGTHLICFELFGCTYQATDHEDENSFMKMIVGSRSNHKFQLNSNHLQRDITERLRKDMEEGLYTVVPLRHPSRVKASWEARDRIGDREDQWQMLIDEVAPYNPTYVHVDQPDIRDKEVALINEDLGLDLHTDWPLRNRSGSVKGLHDTQINDHEKFADFYYSTIAQMEKRFVNS